MRITDLDLSWCEFRPSVFAQLCFTMAIKGNVRMLKLKGLKVTANEAKCLECLACSDHPTLVHLDLSNMMCADPKILEVLGRFRNDGKISKSKL